MWFFSIILASALIFYHWEAMLVSYLSTRKTIMPFSGLADMHKNTNYRLAIIPSTTFEDTFRLSNDTLLQSIYQERFLPHRQEYLGYKNYLVDMNYFVREDGLTALYDSHIAGTSTRGHS